MDQVYQVPDFGHSPVYVVLIVDVYTLGYPGDDSGCLGRTRASTRVPPDRSENTLEAYKYEKLVIAFSVRQ